MTRPRWSSKLRFDGAPHSVTHDIHKKILLVKKLAYASGPQQQHRESPEHQQRVHRGGVTNTSLPQHPCPREQLLVMSRTLANSDGRPSADLQVRHGAGVQTSGCQRQRKSKLQEVLLCATRGGDLPEPPAVTPALGTGRQSTDDVYPTRSFLLWWSPPFCS
ncbi:unnamed protein product [Pleuronectes platessa]|uniref:Dystroglycan C-terminal domain-containing protein n=1 Tax=Pleuronectes platessa TaxID=8262 RepID=A0A9N7UK35_PLEPL|nr:unnamed protein product [Pleuronectes platessa]